MYPTGIAYCNIQDTIRVTFNFCNNNLGTCFNSPIGKIIYNTEKCVRILFGDSKAYKDKFCTCARVRPLGKQALDSEFYRLEHTKPLFNKHKILTIHNLFYYHTSITLYKIIRSGVPSALYALFSFSGHIETRLKSQLTGSKFIDNSTTIWNYIREKLSIDDFDVSISQLKNKLKSYLFDNQERHDHHEWCILNYST